jgi:Mg-chelatase subunit ChlD
LPIALRELPCEPTQRRADVVLVIDASSSMDAPKLAAAKAAAHAFVDAMALPDDQVAVVSFHATAQVVHTLTGDANALHAVIDGIAVAPGTRIDRGLDTAVVELSSTRRHVEHTPVIVLMTDGVQYEEPQSALDAASRARESGTTIYAIGLGADVDGEFLVTVAGAASRYYFAPVPDQLVDIYRGIARAIPCPPEVYWGGRP